MVAELRIKGKTNEPRRQNFLHGEAETVCDVGTRKFASSHELSHVVSKGFPRRDEP